MPLEFHWVMLEIHKLKRSLPSSQSPTHIETIPMTTRLSAIAFTSDIAKLTENFTGQQWVFDDIERWLQESEERFFILTGKPEVGKSAIARLKF